MPIGEFGQEENPELIDWEHIDTEWDVGYLLEVDLAYPKEIHDATQWFPLAAENREITNTMLTSEMKMQLSHLNGIRNYKEDREMDACHKLVGICFDKKEYVVHFKILFTKRSSYHQISSVYIF